MTTPSGHWWEGVTCMSRAVWPPPVDCEAPRSSHRESPGHEPGVKPPNHEESSTCDSLTDGPFTEAKEVVGGYAVLAAESRDEALAAARTFMRPHQQHWPGWEGECEIRELCFLAP